MRILHLTDFHFKNSEKVMDKQTKIVKDLLESIEQVKQVDFIFFTGDLVNSGKEPKDFEMAKSILIDKLSRVSKIQESNIILCPGNHDIFRNQEMSSIQMFFDDKIKSNDDINEFVSNKFDRQYKESLRNSENYRKFVETLSYQESDTVDDLYTIHKRTIENVDIGIATINSAWRAIGNSDTNKLMFPLSSVIEIKEHLSDCKYKIMLMHHRLSDFESYNFFELEDLIYENFNILCAGHIHKRKQAIQLTNDDGMLCCHSPAVLTGEVEKIGYTILDIDLDFNEMIIENYKYDLKSNFNLFSSKPILIPCDKLKKEQNEFRKTIRKRYLSEFSYANELFVSENENGDEQDFNKIFTKPVIMTKSIAEISSENKEKYQYEFRKLIDSKINYVVYGKDKGGKTSLLKKIQLDLLFNFAEFKAIPFYLDFKEFKIKGIKLKLVSQLARYFHMSQASLKEKIRTYHLTILIDNFDPYVSEFNSEIFNFLKEYENVNIIFTSDEVIIRSFDPLDYDDFEFTKLYLHDISRNEIRTLTNKWPNIPPQRLDDIVEKIIQIFSQLNIPYNYWNVSLFLWLFEKNSEFNFHNNVELIELYVDGLLERSQIADDQTSKLSFESFKTYLSELAHHLSENFFNEAYSLSFSELITFTEDYRKHHIRFSIDIEDIVDKIIVRGIIKKREDSRYSFRLKGVFEYFIAFYMKDHEDYRKKITNDKSLYLSFGNEFELYSGFVKKDKAFLELIYNKTNDFYEEVNQKYNSLGNTDHVLLSKINEVFDLKDNEAVVDEKSSPLSPEKKDAILEKVAPTNGDSTEVEQKRIYEDVEKNRENLEKFLFILARVFRNTELIDDEELTKKIFDFIINTTCNFGFALIDGIEEFEKKIEDESITDDNEKQIIKMITNFMPIIIQSFLYDAVGHNNLERLIKDKIKEYKKNSDKNQLKLFLLYYLLIDLDLKNNISIIDEALDVISMNLLKQSAVIKLYLYFMFRTFNQPALEKKLRKKITDYRKKIDRDKIGKKKDLGFIHSSIDEKKKNLLTKKK